MKKSGIIMTILLSVTIPLAIVILSSNVALRLPQTYQFYFNDKQTINRIHYSVPASEMSKEMAKYLSTESKSKFQVYEKNGGFRDPVFLKEDQDAMQDARLFLFKQAVVGLALFIVGFLVHRFLCRRGFEEWRVFASLVTIAVTAVLMIAHMVLVSRSGFRLWVCKNLAGIHLSKKSIMYTLMTGGFLKSYLIFSTVLELILFLTMIYMYWKKRRKKDSIFY